MGKIERLFTAPLSATFARSPEEERTSRRCLKMIKCVEAREDDPEFQSPLTLCLNGWSEKDLEHFAVRQHKKFLLSATRSSISLQRLAPLTLRNCATLWKLMKWSLHHRRTVRPFVCHYCDTDDTFLTLWYQLYTQFFNFLATRQIMNTGKWQLPGPCALSVRRTVNIGQIPKFEKAHSHHTKPGNLRADYLTVAKPVKGNHKTTPIL